MNSILDLDVSILHKAGPSAADLMAIEAEGEPCLDDYALFDELFSYQPLVPAVKVEPLKALEIGQWLGATASEVEEELSKVVGGCSESRLDVAIMDIALIALERYTSSSVCQISYEIPEDLTRIHWNEWMVEHWDIGFRDYFKDAMAEANYVVLGEGHFAIVFYHMSEPGVAIKIGRKKEDSGAAYAAYCRMQWQNYAAGTVGYDRVKHLPEVKHMARLPAFYLVTMPRYKNFEIMTRELSNTVSDIAEHSWSLGNALELCHYEAFNFIGNVFRGQSEPDADLVRKEYMTEVDRVFISVPASVPMRQRVYECRKYWTTKFQHDMMSQSMVDTAYAIHRFFTGVATFDIHSDNLMYGTDINGDDIVIITDPVSFSH